MSQRRKWGAWIGVIAAVAAASIVALSANDRALIIGLKPTGVELTATVHGARILVIL